MDSKLIVMLTHNDHTVIGAKDIFNMCKNSKAEYFGIKEEPLPLETMKELFAQIKEAGKTSVLEIVTYTKEESIVGAQMAVDCNVDILMGTKYSDEALEILKENNILYMPFVGDVHDRPSILDGKIDDMINEANILLEKGVYGFDLLAYRYTKDPVELIEKFVSTVDAPVCLAGGINCFEQLNIINKVKPWGFTIGGAFFEHKFSDRYLDELNIVYDYIKKVAD